MTMTDEMVLSAAQVVDIINHELTYKPAWRIRAELCPWPGDGAGEVDVWIEVEGMIDSTAWGRSSRQVPQHVSGNFHVRVGTREQVENQLMELIIDAEVHEAREFLRFNRDAPFHPHRTDGVARFRACDLARLQP